MTVWVRLSVAPAHFERVREVCADIAARDPTFTFKVEGGAIYVSALDRDHAHRRGLWLKHRVEGVLGYEVIFEEK